MRALIADDDRVTATILGAALQRWGFEVTIAHDGGSAWDLLRAEHPALTILDWMMPGLDGPELCRRIRQDPVMASTYVILVTSRDGLADRVAGLDAGADDYVVKPFDNEELRARVNVGARVAAMQTLLTDQIAQLQQALIKVNQLEGLLPICAYCKKIRSDRNTWEQMEAYISDHSNARFSHGVCPSCLEKLEGPGGT